MILMCERMSDVSTTRAPQRSGRIPPGRRKSRIAPSLMSTFVLAAVHAVCDTFSGLPSVMTHTIPARLLPCVCKQPGRDAFTRMVRTVTWRTAQFPRDHIALPGPGEKHATSVSGDVWNLPMGYPASGSHGGWMDGRSLPVLPDGLLKADNGSA